jgi:hypothetical protein
MVGKRVVAIQLIVTLDAVAGEERKYGMAVVDFANDDEKFLILKIDLQYCKCMVYHIFTCVSNFL